MPNYDTMLKGLSQYHYSMFERHSYLSIYMCTWLESLFSRIILWVFLWIMFDWVSTHSSDMILRQDLICTLWELFFCTEFILNMRLKLLRLLILDFQVGSFSVVESVFLMYLSWDGNRLTKLSTGLQYPTSYTIIYDSQ